MLQKLRENGMKMKVALAPVATAALIAVSPLTALAAEPTAAAFDVNEVLTKGFTSVQGTMLGTISAAVPIVLVIIGAVVSIKFGIKFFRGLAK